MDQQAQREEGRRDSNGHGIKARPSGGGGRRDVVFNNGVDPQLRIMERLGYITAAARLENLCCPLEADGREICLRLHSKIDCARS